MKIIDLLNLIAKGEEVPKKIKCKGYVYWYCNDLKDYENAQVEYKDYLFASKYHSPNWLDYEVEIIEEEIIEEKKIEKSEVALLAQCDNWLQDQVTGEKSRFELNPYIINNIRENTLYFQSKINEIIDVINDMRDKE